MLKVQYNVNCVRSDIEPNCPTNTVAALQFLVHIDCFSSLWCM